MTSFSSFKAGLPFEMSKIPLRKRGGKRTHSYKQLLGASVAGAIVAFLAPLILPLSTLHLLLPEALQFRRSELPIQFGSWGCAPQSYTSELISLDPLLIYIHNFTSVPEASHIVTSGSQYLTSSPVVGYGNDAGGSSARTSRSAPLPGDNPAVECILERAKEFMGTLLDPSRDEIGPAQMVHYVAGQKFDLHTDWFEQPRLLPEDGKSGRKRMYNRIATFFVTLESNCTEGETWFPKVKPIWKQWRNLPSGNLPGKVQAVWREHEHGGLAFRSVPGNALFWVNLLRNGTGDERVEHAGLPVGKGVKTAMNIWPRSFFGPDA